MADSNKYYQFDESRESIENYLERFVLHCDTQELKPERRQKIMLTTISPELYSKVKETLHPKDILKVSFSELQDILLKMFIKQTNVRTKWYSFHKLLQHVGQPVCDYKEGSFEVQILILCVRSLCLVYWTRP